MGKVPPGEIRGLGQMAQREAFRYASKGIGLVPALLMLAGLFVVLPRAFKPIYMMLPHENPYVMYMLNGIIIHEVLYVVPCFFFYLLYSKTITCFEKYRVSNEPWPWEVDPAGYKLALKNIWPTLVLNNVILMPLFMLLNQETGGNVLNSNPEMYPTALEMFTQITVCMLIEDCAFYWSHRMLHSSWLYGKVHKKHHEFTATIGLAATYAHPLEFLFGNLLPFGLGPKFYGNRFHVVTNYLWVVIRLLESVEGHSGYNFPWSPFRVLPLSAGADYHGYHHSKNVGNYCSLFTFWDTVCGTNKKFLEFEKSSGKQE
jgi:sterol desaturase/sphingolipid hydroxylase (fatty acid hydroxylase superfamily)